MSKFSLLIKRICDVVLSSFFIVVTFPIWGFVVVGTLIVFGAPVLYKTKRAGKNLKPIFIYKFRTMTNECDEHGVPLPDKVRLRPFGRFVRRTSMDELPQFLNVFLGQISMVGPRVLPLGHYDVMEPRFRRRAEVKPGLTGWSQVNYTGLQQPWEEKYSYDLEYLEKQSLWFDAKIVLLTFGAVIDRFTLNKTGESQNTND